MDCLPKGQLNIIAGRANCSPCFELAPVDDATHIERVAVQVDAAVSDDSIQRTAHSSLELQPISQPFYRIVVFFFRCQACHSCRGRSKTIIRSYRLFRKKVSMDTAAMSSSLPSTVTVTVSPPLIPRPIRAISLVATAALPPSLYHFESQQWHRSSLRKRLPPVPSHPASAETGPESSPRHTPPQMRRAFR